jgi:hypothetical protein
MEASAGLVGMTTGQALTTSIASTAASTGINTAYQYATTGDEAALTAGAFSILASGAGSLGGANYGTAGRVGTRLIQASNTDAELDDLLLGELIGFGTRELGTSLNKTGLNKRGGE